MKKVLKKMVGLLMAVMMIGSMLVCSVSAVVVAPAKALAADVRTEKPDLLLAKPKAAQRVKAVKKIRIDLKAR